MRLLSRRRVIGPTLFSFCLYAVGCRPFLDALPKIASVIGEAGAVLDEIAAFAGRVFKAKPNPTLETTVEEAIARTRAALVAAGAAARGAQDLGEEGYAKALAAFLEAYQTLLDLTAPLGVRPSGGGLRAAAGDSLEVPPAKAFQ